MERNKYLKERKEVTVIPRRDYYWKYLQEPISISDVIMLTGNDCTESTFKPYNSNTFKVRLSIFLPDKEEITKIIFEKNFEKVKTNFLWFSSTRALHKELDLCLDVFSNNNLYLHACGNIKDEEAFFELYKKELTELNNITYYGFVDINSSIYKNIIKKCAFSIFPSCSEGGGGSLLTCMAHGLIPIATKETSVTIKQNYGILLNDYKIEYISEIVNQASSLSNDKLKNMALESLEFTFKNHNIETYKQDLINALKTINVL